MTNCKSLFVNCTKRSRQKSDCFFVGAFGFLSHQKAEKSFRQEMPETAAEGGEMHTECAVAAGTNFLLGRAKSCQWQVFVRGRPPKQGELRTDVSKATMFQGDRKVTQFFSYFLCFTKSRKRPPQGGREAAERQRI